MVFHALNEILISVGLLFHDFLPARLFPSILICLDQ
jgi:hypothetical protein